MESLTPDQGTAALARLLRSPRVELGVARFDLRRWLEFYPALASIPFFGELQKESGSPRSGGADAARARKALEAAEPSERLSLLERHIAEQVGHVLRLDPSRIDRNAPFSRFNMDSLTSLELRNRLEVSLGLKLPATLLFTYSRTASLAEHLMSSLGFSPPPASEPHAKTEKELPPIPSTVDPENLGTDELLALLAQSYQRVESEVS
jgi:acyl carrier protein